MVATTKIDLPIIRFNDGEELYNFFTANVEKFKDYFIQAIEYGIKNKLDTVEAIELQPHFDHSNSMILCLEKSKWSEILQSLIVTYSNDDNFEKCIELQKLKQQI